MFTKKPWGKLWIIPSTTESGEAHLIKVDADKKCSRHIHENKRNQFVCINGCITIHTWDNGEKRSVTLREGESFTAEAGQEHQFQTHQLEGAEVLERYWLTDIVRLKVY